MTESAQDLEELERITGLFRPLLPSDDVMRMAVLAQWSAHVMHGSVPAFRWDGLLDHIDDGGPRATRVSTQVLQLDYDVIPPFYRAVEGNSYSLVLAALISAAFTHAQLTGLGIHCYTAMIEQILSAMPAQVLRMVPYQGLHTNAPLVKGVN